MGTSVVLLLGVVFVVLAVSVEANSYRCMLTKNDIAVQVDGSRFYLNPCQAVDHLTCSDGVGLCEVSDSGRISYGLPTQWVEFPTELDVVYNGGDACSSGKKRASIVKFECLAGNPYSTESVLKEVIRGDCSLKLVVSSPIGCSHETLCSAITTKEECANGSPSICYWRDRTSQCLPAAADELPPWDDNSSGDDDSSSSWDDHSSGDDHSSDQPSDGDSHSSSSDNYSSFLPSYLLPNAIFLAFCGLASLATMIILSGFVIFTCLLCKKTSARNTCQAACCKRNGGYFVRVPRASYTELSMVPEHRDVVIPQNFVWHQVPDGSYVPLPTNKVV